MDYLKAFIVGGLICAVGQILIDKTKLTPARILVTFVVVGVFLQLIKIYQPLVDFAGAGATVPLTGFGYNLCKGVEKSRFGKRFFGNIHRRFNCSVGRYCGGTCVRFLGVDYF